MYCKNRIAVFIGIIVNSDTSRLFDPPFSTGEPAFCAQLNRGYITKSYNAIKNRHFTNVGFSVILYIAK